MIFGRRIQLPARCLIPLDRKQLIRHAHLDVVGFAREDQQRGVLRLPTKPGNAVIVAAHVRAADRDGTPRTASVRPTRDAEGGGGIAPGLEILDNRPIGDRLDQSAAEEGSRDSEDDVLALRFALEIRRRNSASRRVGPTRDRVEVVHAAVTLVRRLVLEPGFPDGTVELNEVRHAIDRAGLGGDRDLRIHSRARPAHGRMRVTAPTAIEVEPWSQTIGNIFDLLERRAPDLEQRQFVRGEDGDGTASGGGHPTPESVKLVDTTGLVLRSRFRG
jgi:hypothetical protein